MIVYSPKHKKSLSERLNNSIIHDELDSTDFYLGFSVADTLELNKAIETDKTLKPMDYYEDEIYAIKSCILVAIICLIAVMCFVLTN